MGKKTSIYLNAKLSELLKKYAPRWGEEGELSDPITTAFDRYDVVVRAERRTIRDLFTKAEINLMLNNALSTSYGPSADILLGAVLADTEDEIDETLELYGVDRSAIIAKLRGLTPGQQVALVDWLEEMREGVGKE